MATLTSINKTLADNTLSTFDIFCWRLLIWALGLVTPLLAALKPRIFMIDGVEIVESATGLNHLVIQGVYCFFLLLASVAFIRNVSTVNIETRQRRGRSFWLITIILAAMPTISSFISGGTLQLTIIGIIGIYSATYFLPSPPLDWLLREIRTMLLAVFVYGSFVAAVLFPGWAWHKDYATQSTVAIFPMRLFGTANHANSLAPLAITAWMLGRFPDSRLRWERLHSMAIFFVLLLSQSKTNWIIIIFLLCVYILIKIKHLNNIKKYSLYLSIGLSFVFGSLYLIKYSPYASRIQDLMYDPQILTLTGRLPLWIFAFNMWQEKPWIGQGLDAWSSDALLDYIRLFGWAAPHAHNQVLQTLSQAGLFGLSVMIIWGLYVLRTIQVAPLTVSIPLRWLCVFFILPGFTEVILQFSLGPGNTVLTWIMFVIILIIGKAYCCCEVSIETA